ncbi:glycosyltransferase [Gryllotalpicola sp.]|uniref:glycosyltransferase n=1 Tax=Gryllotalpicola sp. TaxID=1932787 RepID=UPI00261B8DE4|nr:glycosyltransferase [Gryllotalpicola sp.]
MGDLGRIAIVIVTFNRTALLGELLDSAARLTTAPWRIIVVDNASTDGTADVVEAKRDDFPEGLLVYRRLETNTGGAGGFSAGTGLALELGADWMWLMDDDVEILPDALDVFAPWMARFKCLHGRRYDVDGTDFYWQAKFNQWLGVPLPYSIRTFDHEGYAITNSGTFEGMMIHADIVRAIGLPDPRFFISWDDAVYGWLAAQHTPVAYVNAYVLRKKREQRQISLGVRHLNDSSALAKYHVMRNRGYVARYFALYGKLHPVGFAAGTVLTFGKEVVRLVAVERTLTGLGALLRGWRDSIPLRRDPTWRPMPPLLGSKP